jgi:LacI family transcriptional regulator
MARWWPIKIVAFASVSRSLPLCVRTVVGCRDLVALGALAELGRCGIDVPGAMSVVGFDDDPVAETLGLTTVRHPFEESGRLALRTLRGMIAAPHVPVADQRLQLTLVERATTGTVPR